MSQHRFTDEAIEEARLVTLSDSLWERPQVKGFTIDDETSQDLDDAIWIEMGQSGATISVHIADASEVIPIGTALDVDAIARCQTQYLGDHNLPMIPPRLSQDLLSLLEQEKTPDTQYPNRCG